MTASARLGLSWTDAGLVALAALGVYATVVLYTRIAGPRSLASMSSFDFAVTVAIGAIVGRVVLVRTTLLAGVLGLGVLFALQAALGFARNRKAWGRVIDNEPILLLHHGRILDSQLRRAHMNRDDVLEQVRIAGHGRLDTVRAVVLERSGRVSVITGDEGLDSDLFDNVRGWQQATR